MVVVQARLKNPTFVLDGTDLQCSQAIARGDLVVGLIRELAPCAWLGRAMVCFSRS
jgi:hypothetical protein